MPMAAMFMRNKFLAWFALLSTVHYALTTEPDANADQSAVVKVLMSLVSLAVCYINVAFPQPGPADAIKAQQA